MSTEAFIDTVVFGDCTLLPAPPLPIDPLPMEAVDALDDILGKPGFTAKETGERSPEPLEILLPSAMVVPATLECAMVFVAEGVGEKETPMPLVTLPPAQLLLLLLLLLVEDRPRLRPWRPYKPPPEEAMQAEAAAEMEVEAGVRGEGGFAPVVPPVSNDEEEEEDDEEEDNGPDDD